MSGVNLSEPALPGPLRREPALDGIRGLATLAVMLFHFTMFEQSSQPLYRAGLALASLGWASVDLFFVLSGFLITGILLDTKGQQHFFRNFYARRALRILPLCYAVLAVVMLLLVATASVRTPESREFLGRQVWLWTYTTNIEFLVYGHWNFNLGRLWLNHFWTLAVEEQFYLVWPVVVFALRRRALVAVTLGLVVVAPLLRAIMILHDVRPGIVLTLTPCRVDALALGALAAVLARDPALRPRVLRGLPWLAVAALPPLVWLGWTRRLYWLDPVVVAVALSLLALIACSAVLQCALAPDGRLARMLRISVLRFLGKYSYGIYLFHYMLWPSLEQYLPAARLSAASGSDLAGLAGHVLAGVALSTAAGFVSFHVLERHFLGLKRNFSYTSRLRMPSAASRAERPSIVPGAEKSTPAYGG